MKTCHKCHQEKPIDEFYADSARRDGRRPICRPCKAIEAKKRYDRVRAQLRDERYGFARGQYDAMLDAQGGTCCFSGCEVREFLVVDHDHETGCVRGILCRNHNTLLGYAKDDPSVLQDAIDYLKIHEQAQTWRKAV